MCAANVYCCRPEGEETTDCCNNTAALSKTTSPIGLPTEAVAAVNETITPSVVALSGSTGLPITSTVVTTAAASNITYASARETKLCPGTSKIIAVMCDSAFEVSCRDPSHSLAHMLMPEKGVRIESSEQVTMEVAWIDVGLPNGFAVFR